MWCLLVGSGIMLAGAAAVLVAGRGRHWGAALAVGALWIGCLTALVPVAATLTGRPPLPLTLPWSIPWGAFTVALDGLSAFFLLPLLIIAPLAALYGYTYLNRTAPEATRSWFFFNLLIAGMLLLPTARNGFLFLLIWETMALASFFLVVVENQRISVCKAGWTYLVASHLGASALLVFFIILGNLAGSFDFERFTALKQLSPALASGLFFLALAGFGTKAGILPLHVWLPEAHPAAPSHVSAVMSAVMIKTGIYGLLRALTFLGPPLVIWGWTLLLVGLASALFGIAMALAQHDLKRLLAYSSVENSGIIILGIGVGLLGMAWDLPLLAALGLFGALLHVLNHTLFKGLLFLGAGAILQATGTREMNRLGGLIKAMPWTGVVFLVGAAAISGLPPFNGFVSEFLLYYAGLQAALVHTTPAVILAAIVLGGLALIGGLTAACFTKCFGLVFLGAPRDATITARHDSPWPMRWPMVLLALFCLVVGLAAAFVPTIARPAVITLCGASTTVGEALSPVGGPLAAIAGMGALLLALTVIIFLLRRRTALRRPLTIQGTWDCGYAQPTSRMQYTPSSYAQPLVDLFHTALGTHRTGQPVNGYFPMAADFSSHTPDAARKWLFGPLFGGLARMLAPLRLLQHGRIHLYVLSMALVLIGLLLWKASV